MKIATNKLEELASRARWLREMIRHKKGEIERLEIRLKETENELDQIGGPIAK